MDERELADLLARHASAHSVPGAAIGILRDGRSTCAHHGTADATTGEPIGPESRFSAGSLTKSMVATVIARLAGESRLSFDDSVANHVPELHDAQWAQRATIKDLLANRSRLPLSMTTEFGFSARRETDDEAISRLVADLAKDATPIADIWSYSNAGWSVLGRIIETVAGAPWENAMQRLLFEPLGMTATGPTSHSRVSGHETGPAGPVPVAPLTSRAYGPAGAGLASSASDLLRFAAWNLEDPTLASLRTPDATVCIHGWFDSWCLGWARFDWPGGPVWGWDGLVNGERSVLRLLPQHKAAVVLMTNSGTGRAMYRSLFAELMEVHFDIQVPPLRLAPSALTTDDLSRYAGVYAWPDRRVEVVARAGGLLLKGADGQTKAMPIDEQTFLVDAADPDNPTVTFGAFNADGQPQVLYLMLWGLPRTEPT
jgi:CubicO group peptidase (beta-lactamase class C family)